MARREVHSWIGKITINRHHSGLRSVLLCKRMFRNERVRESPPCRIISGTLPWLRGTHVGSVTRLSAAPEGRYAIERAATPH